MKNNLKTKVMLAVLAGGMLCANGVWAANWYGTTDNKWTTVAENAVTSGLTLTVVDGQTVDSVTLAGAGCIYGGYTGGSEAVKNNSITFNTTNAATTAAIIYGADTDSGDASGNSVNIKNGTFSGDIYGSKIHNISTTGTATKNSVNIADGTFSGKIYGGFNYGSTATKNSVVIDGGTFSKTIYGAQGVGVDGNSVTINNGTFKTDVFGGDATKGGTATNNIVTINNGVFDVNNKYVYGGVSNSGDVTGNKVIINDGQFTGTQIWAGKAIGTPCGDATNNVVTIEGGNFNNVTIYGGYSNSGNATGNTVTIKDGTFSGTIFGGNSNSGNATGNIVTIEGGTFSENFFLYGGKAGYGKTSSGNILNLKTKIGGKAKEVKYFQIMNFTLPADIANNGIMLTTASITYDNTKINVTAADGVSLKKDDKIYLVKADAKFGGVDTTNSTALGGAGVISLLENDLILTLLEDFGGSGDTATTKAIAEGIAASLAFVNQGADMVAGSGIDGLYVADSENPTIAAFSGNKTRYNTGSHVDIHGWNALVGIALNNKESFSHGVFVEIGNGDIDTYAALNGSGSSDYKGGGYMLRKDMGKGWTIDGAVRAGRVETSWSNNDKGGYEAKQTYYGAHVTFNKMLKEYGEQKLNGYLRYTFTHLGSDSVNLDGTHYGFDSVNSHRTRLGARMVDEGQNGFELYYGAAWEYGFGGDCDANVNGVTISGPAVDGSNAVFEVGGTWSDNKWEINAGLEGYAGAKRGVAGGMNFVYKF